jgi:hypothetical protein
MKPRHTKQGDEEKEEKKMMIWRYQDRVYRAEDPGLNQVWETVISDGR